MLTFSGHVSVIGVRVYLGHEPDWSNLDRDPDLNMDVYLNGENRYSATQITQAIKQLTALLTPTNA